MLSVVYSGITLKCKEETGDSTVSTLRPPDVQRILIKEEQQSEDESGLAASLQRLIIFYSHDPGLRPPSMGYSRDASN